MSESPAAASPNADELQEDVPVTDAPEADIADNISDDGSELSEVNEDEFADFDVNAINIEEADIDRDALKEVKVRRKERKPGEEPRKKKKEGRKEKQQRSKTKRRRGEDDDEVSADGADADAPRGRRRKDAADGGEKKQRKVREETPEDQLDAQERSRRQIERSIAEAIKRPTGRKRRQAGDDLAGLMDEEISSLRTAMNAACDLDNKGRLEIPPKPAVNKLLLLPKVMAILNRNGRDAETAITDPENNLLESVRYFLEPLQDGSLPAYNIQRELFGALVRLPIGKETLIASGIGRIILFYTKCRRVEATIKRISERLLAEWTRPILRRTDDYRKRSLIEVEYDPTQTATASSGRASQDPRAIAMAKAKAVRAKALERSNPGNRARLERPEQVTYNVVPKSNLAHMPRKR